MRRTAHRNGSPPRKGAGELRVTSDLSPETPICEAELAAIEAFLWQELRKLLDDSASPKKESPAGGAKSASLCHNGEAARPRPRRKTA
jgi:hypothetical protein